MDTIEEELTTLHLGAQQQEAVDRLHFVHSELTAQKSAMERVVKDTGGLEAQEERRLIELGEAVDAVEEALQYKNNVIAHKQLVISDTEQTETDQQQLRNVEFLLDQMGPMSKLEYRHLLGKFFLKVTELRRAAQRADEARCHFELQASQHEQQLQDVR